MKKLCISCKKEYRKQSFLRLSRASIEKSIEEKSANCWNILRDQLTTTWLETANVKVIKLSDIGQSAAKPLNSKEQEEGSETIYTLSKV